jgi:hypothetical protein
VSWLAFLSFASIAAAALAVASSLVRHARRAPDEPASRSAVIAVAAAAATIGAVAVYLFGLAPAIEGERRIEAGAADSAPRARLFLRQVQLPTGARRIGYSPDADVLLPRIYRLLESERAWDLIDIALDEPGDQVTARPIEPPEPTPTRLRFHASPAPPSAADLHALARRCRDPAADPGATGAHLAVALCVGPAPRAVLEIETAAGGAVLAAHVWRGHRLEPHHIEIEPGSLVQIGSIGDAIPGVTLWEVPAPAGRSELFAAPDDLLAGCDAFSRSMYAGDPARATGGRGAICPLPLAPPFALEVRRLLPDVAGVTLRATWALGLILAPLLGWALALALRRRGELSWRDVGGLVRFAVASAALAGIAAARLLWAHRIDMLRDWEVAGARVADNQLSIACLAAALAGCAAVCASTSRRGRASVGTCAVAFVAAFGLAWFGLPAGLPLSWSAAGQLVLAAAVASAPLWHRRAAAALETISPAALAVAVGAAAVLAAELWPRLVILKLALAWIAVLAAYRAIQSPVSASSRSPGRVGLGLAAAAAAAAGVAVFDTGLAAVIVVPGLLFSIALAGHDALFADEAAAEVDSYRLRHAPVIAIQGALLMAVLLYLIAFSFFGLGSESGDDGTLAQQLTGGAPHLLWLIAAVLAAPAWVSARAGDRRTALLFAAAAALAIAAWIARDLVAELILGSSAPAAQRYAIIADPGYALLADPGAFLSGVTAWAETIGAADLWRGQGYFGAQLLDPGVLLSIENDYLPVLILRELGALGTTAHALAALGAVAGAYAVGRERFRHASPAARARLVTAAVLGLLIVYQPLAALGTLPLTGVSWLGLGVDSPSDLWIAVALLIWLTAVSAPEQGDGELDAYDRVLRSGRRFRRRHRLVALVGALAMIAGVALVARASVFAARRPAPVDSGGLASAPFAGLEAALDYARGLRCEPGPWPALHGQPSDRGTRRFHRELTAGVGPAGVERGLIRVESSADECAVIIEDRVVRKLRLREREPFKHARVRLVSRPMGRAATDRGELVSGDVAIRLRGTAEAMAAPEAPGIHAARRVELSPDIAVEITGGGQVVLERGENEPAGSSWLFVSSPPAPGRLHPIETSARWSPIPASADSRDLVLDGSTLIVVGRGPGRSVWLFRPAGDEGAAPLLADDSDLVTGERRRLYVYGNQLPELGWVNRFRRSMSLGLDGWVAAALAEYDPQREPAAPACGTLEPEPADISRVCRPDAAEGVIECQVSLQPELTIRLRHLTELIAASPTELAGARAPLPLAASFFLMRGDTGEIVAQGEHVPGRASPAYAPATPALETYLIRAREMRDPRTGQRLPPERRGESSAEKLEHGRPIAIGSVFKPMLARAFEQTAPALSRYMVLVGAPFAGAVCRSGAHAILGHCPPTDSLWNQRRALDMSGYVSQSANWFQAAIGLLGTALPDGEVGLGAGPAQGIDTILARSVGDFIPDEALWTRRGGERIVGADHKIDLEALRETPMWRRFEALLGRPLCTDGNKTRCRRAGFRRDVCAARALPIAEVSPDLRHLVALGPDRFDFYPQLARKDRTVTRVPTREYLQFLRGSGLHALGSLAQVTDAFNRVVFEADRDPLRHGGYQLAASWFPVAPTGQIPPQSCARRPPPGTVAAGLCAAVTEGTARSLAGWLADPGIEIYGAKTGTIDSLGDVAASPKGCKRFREGRSLVGRRADAEAQPYWIECGKRTRELDDSLLLISFAIRSGDGERVPLTLGLRFQRSGLSFAGRVASHYLAVIKDYFQGAGGLP